MEELLKVQELKKYFPVKRGLFIRQQKWLHAVDGVSFEVSKKKVFGLVGESGCGKTTIGRAIVKLTDPTYGHIYLNGKDTVQLDEEGLKDFRKNVGMIFQDPYESLNPRFTILDSVKEPLDVHETMSKEEKVRKVIFMLKDVGLEPTREFLKRYPHELSGGQRQRIAMARALIVNPRIVVADEPCSMLDVSIRAGMMNLMLKLKEEFGLSLIYITHDLSEARHITDFMAVMYLGKIVETGVTEDLIENPHHPYTKALISAVPDVDPDIERERIKLFGDIPTPVDLPPGCRFCSRCPYAADICKRKEPEYRDLGNGHLVACHHLF